MHETLLMAAGLLGLALICAATVLALGRVRSEQQRTLQKLIERGLAGDELLRAAGILPLRHRDRRRGLWLIALGLVWAGCTYFIGGPAWRLGLAPVLLGLASLAMWKLDDRGR
jgi:hypothetical protein